MAKSSGGTRGGSASGGYRSGVGSNKSYGLDKYERFTFEALKSDAQYGGNVWENSSGEKMYTVMALGGKNYSEAVLASEIKSQFKTQMAHTGQSGKSLAAYVTKYLTNIKTGEYFGNMAENI